MQTVKRLFFYGVKFSGYCFLGLSVSTLCFYVFLVIYSGTAYFGLFGFIMWTIILGGIPLGLFLNRWANDRLRRLKVITAFTSYKF